jgi:predicted kinase
MSNIPLYVIIPIGPAGAGKTSLWEGIECMSPFRVSPDEIRFEKLNYSETGVSFDPAIEPEVWEEAYARAHKAATIPSITVIYFDATNLTHAKRYQLISRIRMQLPRQVVPILVYFHYPLLQCLQQNRKRDRQVPEAVIARQFLSLEPPASWEGHVIQLDPLVGKPAVCNGLYLQAEITKVRREVEQSAVG